MAKKYAILGILILIVLSLLFLFNKEGIRNLQDRAYEKESSKNDFERFFVKKEGKAPDFILLNQNGVEVSLKDFKGKVVVMTYIYTACKEACPLLEAKFLDIQDIFRDRLGKDIVLISLTIDPERDTPEVLRKHAENLGADLNGWVFLTGKKKDIERTLKAYNFFYEKEEDGHFIHENRYTIIDRDGNLAYEINGQLPSSDPLIWRLMGMLEGMA